MTLIVSYILNVSVAVYYADFTLGSHISLSIG